MNNFLVGDVCIHLMNKTPCDHCLCVHANKLHAKQIKNIWIKTKHVENNEVPFWLKLVKLQAFSLK